MGKQNTSGPSKNKFNGNQRDVHNQSKKALAKEI